MSRKRAVTYRTERFDVHFNVKVSREVRAALRDGAVLERMRDAHFARMVIELGLVAWRARLGDVRLAGRVVAHRGLVYGSGILFDFQMSPQMRGALSIGACAEGLRISEFTRMIIDWGLEAWRERRAPNSRAAGAA